MASGMISLTDGMRALALPIGETCTVFSQDRGSQGAVTVLTADASAQVLASGPIAPNRSVTFGPYNSAASVQVTTQFGALAFQTKAPAGPSPNAYRFSTPITPGTNVPAGDGVSVACSAPGYVRLLTADGSYLDIYAQIGTAIIDNIAVIGVDATNTAATVKVTNLRRG